MPGFIEIVAGIQILVSEDLHDSMAPNLAYLKKENDNINIYGSDDGDDGDDGDLESEIRISGANGSIVKEAFDVVHHNTRHHRPKSNIDQREREKVRTKDLFSWPIIFKMVLLYVVLSLCVVGQCR